MISIGDFIVMKPEVQRRPEVWTKLWEGIANREAGPNGPALANAYLGNSNVRFSILHPWYVLII